MIPFCGLKAPLVAAVIDLKTATPIALLSRFRWHRSSLAETDAGDRTSTAYYRRNEDVRTQMNCYRTAAAAFFAISGGVR
jgi:hypothetical protein